jgi:hypothetical protein
MQRGAEMIQNDENSNHCRGRERLGGLTIERIDRANLRVACPVIAESAQPSR